MNFSRANRAVTATIALVGAIYVVTCLLLPSEGAWVVDTANKRMQLQAVIASGFSSFDIPWRGHTVDPSFAFNPIPAPFAVVQDGRLFSQYSPLFATISAPFYLMFGERGLVVLPLLGALVVLAAVARLARAAGLNGPPAAICVAVAGLATPLWFYSQVFWEHTLSVACLLWALVFAIGFAREGGKRRLVLLSLCCALSAYVREETLLLFPVIWLLVLRGSRHATRRAVLGSAAIVLVSLVPLMLFLALATGSLGGHHVQSNLSGITTHLMARGRVFYNLFLAVHPDRTMAWLVGLPAVGLLAIRPRLSQGMHRRAFAVLALLALAWGLVYLGRFIASASPFVDLLHANALLAVSPFLLLGLLRRKPTSADAPSSDVSNLMWKACLGYALGYFAIAPEISSQGIHWGCRYLLLLYPVLAVLAVEGVASWQLLGGRRWSPRVVVVALAATSVLTQVFSLDLLRRKKLFSQALAGALHSRSETTIVSDIWWAPQEMYSVFQTKAIYYVSSGQSLPQLIQALSNSGVTNVLLATKPGSLPNVEPLFSVDDFGLNFYTLSFYQYRLPARR
jgi:hypothetical protein